MNSETAVRNLSALRTVVGTSAWLTPRLAGKAFMLDPDANPQSPYLARLFGVRDVAMGYGTQTATGDARRTWLTVGVAVDAADALAAFFGGRRGYLTPVQTVLLAAPAIAATAMGIVALTSDDAP